MQQTLDLVLQIMKEVASQPFKHEISGADARYNGLKTLEPYRSSVHDRIGADKINIRSTVEVDNDADAQNNGKTNNGDQNDLTLLPEVSDEPFHEKSSNMDQSEIIVEEKSIALHSNDENVVAVSKSTSQDSLLNEGSCVQYVAKFCGKSYQFKTIWSRAGYVEGQDEIRKIRRNKKRTHSVANNDNESNCILSTEYNKSFLTNYATQHVAKSDSEKTDVRIGSIYQVNVPRISNNKRLNRCSTLNVAPDLVWDPQQARKATLDGEDIEGFLSKTDDLNLKMLLMEALHRSKYNVRIAMNIFVDLYSSKPSCDSEYGNVEEFSKTFSSDHFRKTKDFQYVASKLNCSKEIALIHYYRWKKSIPNNPDLYLSMKHERHKESEVCDVCDSGGNLIVCDHCNHAYHLNCLTPPLTMIPHGKWFCSECEARSPAKLRRLTSYHKMNGSSTHDSATKKNQDHDVDAWVNVAPVKRLESLKRIHKELFNCIEKPMIKSAVTHSPVINNNIVKQATYSPANMTWDSDRGFWIENAADELTVSHKIAPTSNGDKERTSISKNHDRILLTDKKKRNESLDYKGVESIGSVTPQTGPAIETPELLRGQTYHVRLPITSEGLLIFIEKGSGKFTSFSGYRQTSTGVMSFAQTANLFMAKGDFILEVDNVPCFNKSFFDVKSLLKTPRPNAIKLLKMFHPLNVSQPKMSR